MGVIWGSLGVLWRSFWTPRGDIEGSLEVLLAALGCLGGPLGVLWVSKGATGSPLGASGLISGILREIPGALLASFSVLFAYFLGVFLRSFAATSLLVVSESAIRLRGD